MPTFSPLKSGYDHFYGFRGGALDYFRHTTGADTPDLWDEDKQVPQEGYLTDLFGDRAVKVISDHARGAIVLPEPPLQRPALALGDSWRSGRIRSSPRPGSGPLGRWFTGDLSPNDHGFGCSGGRVLQGLDDNGIARDTIVIFTSDNGGERFVADTWPFSGKKM